jgi:hypothetical protein
MVAVASPRAHPRSDRAVAAPTPRFGETERARLRRLAGALIPASDTMPGADEVGVADDLLDAVLAARPDLIAELRAALAGDSPAETTDSHAAVEQLRTSARGAYRALVLVVIAAYYRAPEVQRRIGYPGQEPRAVSALAYPEYIAEGLLDHLVGS